MNFKKYIVLAHNLDAKGLFKKSDIVIKLIEAQMSDEDPLGMSEPSDNFTINVNVLVDASNGKELMDANGDVLLVQNSSIDNPEQFKEVLEKASYITGVQNIKIERMTSRDIGYKFKIVYPDDDIQMKKMIDKGMDAGYTSYTNDLYVLEGPTGLFKYKGTLVTFSSSEDAMGVAKALGINLTPKQVQIYPEETFSMDPNFKQPELLSSHVALEDEFIHIEPSMLGLFEVPENIVDLMKTMRVQSMIGLTNLEDYKQNKNQEDNNYEGYGDEDDFGSNR